MYHVEYQYRKISFKHTKFVYQKELSIVHTLQHRIRILKVFQIHGNVYQNLNINNTYLVTSDQNSQMTCI